MVRNPDGEPADERLEFEARVRGCRVGQGWNVVQRRQQISALLDMGDEQLVAAAQSDGDDTSCFS